jgi:dienelactone hydrolase
MKNSQGRALRYLPAIAVGLAFVAGCMVPGGGGGGQTGTMNGANFEVVAGLANHTIWSPPNLATVTKPLPLVVWGNGMCSGESKFFGSMLAPLAASGVVVFSNGTPGGSASTTANMLIQSVDFAIKENARQGSKYFGKLDTNAISAQGQSCGGLQALQAAADPRIKSTIAWNSGGVGAAGLAKLHGPVAWLNGGSSDLAYSQSRSDFAAAPAKIPAVMGSYKNVGHMGLWTDAALAKADAVIAKDFINAAHYGDAQAKAQFVGASCGLCTGKGWTMQSKNW